MRLGSLSLVLFAVAVLVALPASAESPPPGSYQGTCTNIKVQKLLGGPGKNLTATHKRTLERAKRILQQRMKRPASPRG